MEYGLIAKRLGHSFSKEVHSMLADYSYELRQLSEKELDAFMKAKEFKAINVTIPYKEAVIPYLNEISEVAKDIGSVNTIVNNNGYLMGYNTDFLALKYLIEKSGIEIKGKKVLVLGSGGTSKTAVAVAKNMGSESIITVSRTGLNGAVLYEEVYEKHTDAEVIINATPKGMYPDISGCAIDVECFKNLKGFVDAIYNPLKTELAIRAQKQGAVAVCGLYMLVAQGVFASEKFLGKTFENGVIDRVYKKLLKEKQNIVLIGMPSCGKSTIGKLLAENLNRPFYDTDSLIEEKTGKTPAEIISAYGEEHFRNIESNVIEEVSAVLGAVISTGGGAVLKEKNCNNLHKNGVICFIDRPLENLVATENRPLSNTKEALLKIYNQRYKIYCSVADFVLKGEMSCDEAVKRIKEVTIDENSCN